MVLLRSYVCYAVPICSKSVQKQPTKKKTVTTKPVQKKAQRKAPKRKATATRKVAKKPRITL